jgi:hypothetical protein
VAWTANAACDAGLEHVGYGCDADAVPLFGRCEIRAGLALGSPLRIQQGPVCHILEVSGLDLENHTLKGGIVCVVGGDQLVSRRSDVA